MASAEGSQRGQFGSLFLVVFVSLVGFGVVLPVFPFFSQLVGASPAEITLAMAAYSLGQFIGAPLWGKISDRIGRRPVLIVSLIGGCISYIIMAHAHDIWVLGLARLFGGFMAGNIAAAFAYVGDITTPQQRPKAMGLLGAAFGLGFILGPAIGGIVGGSEASFASFRNVSYVAAGITALATIATILVLKESLTPERRAQAQVDRAGVGAAQVLAAKPILWALMALTLLVIGSAAMMETTFAFFAGDAFQWGPMQVGIAFACVGIISAGLQGLATSALVKRFGEGRLVVIGVALYALGLFGLSLVETGTQALAALMVTAAGVGLFNPSFQSLVSGESDDSDRGLINGLTQGASSLGRIIGPAVSGSLYAGLGMRAPFEVGAAIMLIALVLAVLAARAHANHRERIARNPAE
jgi:MFS transporter, DHA1 family, tetracycline resistance protein